MTDKRGRVWKPNEDGFRCLILREEYRDLFMLRRKKLTYQAIGNMYQISRNHVRTLVERYQRRRRVKVSWYLESRKSRGKDD